MGGAGVGVGIGAAVGVGIVAGAGAPGAWTRAAPGEAVGSGVACPLGLGLDVATVTVGGRGVAVGSLIEATAVGLGVSAAPASRGPWTATAKTPPVTRAAKAVPTTASAMRGRSRIERMNCSTARVDRISTASVEVAGGSVCAPSCGKTAVDALMPTVEEMVCSPEAMLRNGLDTSAGGRIVPTGYITRT
jgi:hypothetical protein